MARIRSIKPEIWHSHDMCRLSILGRLVVVILITQADDEGRLHTDAAHVSSAYLGDPRLAVDVDQQLRQMERQGMLQRYRDTNGLPCIALLNWTSHQRIDRPSPSRIQKPPEIRRKLANSRERSVGIRSDQTGSDRVDQTALAVVAGPVEQVFQAWVKSTERSDRTLLDPKRRRVIERALDGYPVDDVLLAVDGWRYSPHHRGENDRGVVYNDLELLLRDSKHVEMFRDLAMKPGTVVPLKPSLSRSYRERASELREAGS